MDFEGTRGRSAAEAMETARRERRSGRMVVELVVK
jgi:hypothetical protein